MEQDWRFYLQVISTFSVLLPVVMGLLFFREIGSLFWYFIGFLIVGFLVDFAGWIFYITENGDANNVVRYAYSLFEPLFLIWFLGQFGPNTKLKFLLKNVWIIILPLWLISVFSNDFFPIYKTTTQIFISSASCFYILKFVEKESNIIHDLTFWVLIGIFFYNFCTFFLMGFLNTTLGLDLWYLHNVINVLTNLLYFVGFCFYSIYRSDLGTH